MKERKRLAEATAGRYRQARKLAKAAILNEFVEVTGFARSYAALVLRNHGRVVQVNRRLRVRGVVGLKRRGGRQSYYDELVVKALLMPTACAAGLFGRATNGTSMKCSSVSMGAFIICGVQWIKMATCWTSWSKADEIRKPPRSSFASY
jgi:hypothetical protein